MSNGVCWYIYCLLRNCKIGSLVCNFWLRPISSFWSNFQFIRYLNITVKWKVEVWSIPILLSKGSNNPSLTCSLQSHADSKVVPRPSLSSGDFLAFAVESWIRQFPYSWTILDQLKWIRWIALRICVVKYRTPLFQSSSTGLNVILEKCPSLNIVDRL